MVQRTLQGNPCTRCGNTSKRREPKPYTPLADEYEFIDTCITCGHETFGRPKEKDLEVQRAIHFKQLKRKSYELGLRKYRNNKADRNFQGSPMQVAQKNLAALSNCLDVIHHNSKELDLLKELSEKDYKVISQIIEKLFEKMSKLDSMTNNHGTNEFRTW